MNKIKDDITFEDRVSQFVEDVVTRLNQKDDSVVGIVTTDSHAFYIIDEIIEKYECTSEYVQWDNLEDCDEVIICIFNNGQTGILAAQPLYNEVLGTPCIIGADHTFVDVSLEKMDFIDKQGSDFDYTVFNLEPNNFECDGDCCNCEYYEEEKEDTFEKTLMDLCSAAIEFARCLITEE